MRASDSILIVAFVFSFLLFSALSPIISVS